MINTTKFSSEKIHQMSGFVSLKKPWVVTWDDGIFDSCMIDFYSL